jgi:hypothetical protein
MGLHDSNVVFGKEFPNEKEIEAVSFVAKVRGEVFAHFHAVAVKSHSSMRN